MFHRCYSTGGKSVVKHFSQNIALKKISIILVWCWNGEIEHENYINTGYYNSLPVDVNQPQWVYLETIIHGMSFVPELCSASIAKKKMMVFGEIFYMRCFFNMDIFPLLFPF